MPALIPIIAAVAGAAASYGTLVVAGVALKTAFGLAGMLLVSSIVGAVVATAVGYGLNAAFGVGKAPKSSVAAGQERKQTIRSSIAPRQMVYGTARVSGPIVYASSSGDQKQYLHLVVPVAGHRVLRHIALWINDKRIPIADIGEAGDNGNGFVKVAPYYSPYVAWPYTPERAFVRLRFFNGSQTAASSELIAETNDGWSSAHVLRGTAYMYLRLQFDRDVFGNGPGAISVEVEGSDTILDPRTNTSGWTNNPALCILDYLRSADGMACSADEIDTASFIAAANICDEAVIIDATGTTQKRYELDGTFSLDEKPLEIIDKMLTSCAGTLVYVAGKYRLHAGAYSAATDTLTTDDLAGPIELVTKPPRRELFNTVRGTFISSARNWQATEFPPYAEAALVTADGETITTDVEWPFTIDEIRAQRLAKLTLRRAREALTVRVAVKYSGLRYSVWQMLNVTLSHFGWTNKPFRIVSWTFDPASGIVNLTLREESSTSYEWQFGNASPSPLAPDTDLVNPFTIPAPAGIETTEELYATRDGAGVRTRIQLIWGASPSAFVRRYEVQAKTAASSDWLDVGGGIENKHEIEDVAADTYDFRVRAVGYVANSPWISVRRFVGALAAMPPADVTGLAIQSVGGLAFLRWDRHPDLDVRVGGRFEIRHTPLTASPLWSDATTIADSVTGEATFALVPMLAGTYLIKAVDAGHVYAAGATSILARSATALTFSNLSTATEHTAFSGTKTNTVVAASRLKLATGASVGSYAFAAGIDLSTVKNVRLSRRILAAVINESALWDSRTDLIDEWLGIDDIVVGGQADAWVEMRQTDDNPAGSPTWSSWARLEASEFRARAFEFRAQLRRFDATYNIEIAELSATADEVA
jgi:hypothetical protein